jgi:hypothetical protein
MNLGGGAIGSSIYVAVAGGVVSTGLCPCVLASATLVYDTVADSWSSLEVEPLNGSKIQGASLLGNVYLVSLQSEFLGYDPQMALLDPAATPVWSTPQGPPTQRFDGAVAASASKLFVVGGSTWVDFGSPQIPSVTGALDVYDPKSGSWSTPQGAPTARAAGAAAVVGNALYFIGGWTGTVATPIPSSVVEAATCLP